MTRLNQALVQAQRKVQNTDILAITMPTINRMKVEEKSDKTITSYVRAVERLVRFHGLVHPRDLDIKISHSIDLLFTLDTENSL